MGEAAAATTVCCGEGGRGGDDDDALGLDGDIVLSPARGGAATSSASAAAVGFLKAAGDAIEGSIFCPHVCVVGAVLEFSFESEN